MPATFYFIKFNNGNNRTNVSILLKVDNKIDVVVVILFVEFLAHLTDCSGASVDGSH